MRTRILPLLAVLIASATLCAQEPTNRKMPVAGVAHPLEVAIDYGTVRTNGPPGNCDCFWIQGGSAEVNLGLFSQVSLVSELSSYDKGNANSAGEGLGLFSYLFGPRYSIRTHSGVVPFGQVLFGGVHGFNGIFPTNGRLASPNSFALAAGGGMNVNVSHHFAIRVFEADYYLTQLPNGVNSRENNLRISAGVVFRFRGE